MSWLNDLLSGNKGTGINTQAQAGVSQSQNAYNNLAAPTLSSVAPQAAAQNPAYTGAQTAQMGALSNLAANGGRSAASDAAQAQITGQEGAQAQSQRNSALQNAAQRGMSNGNTALLGELSGNQAAANTAASQGAQLAGNQANTALQAGQGAAGIGANLANASDTMARYNAGQNLQGQEYNSQLPQEQFQDQNAIAQGVQRGGQDTTDYYSNLGKQNAGTQQAQVNGIIGLGTGILGSSGTDGSGNQTVGGKLFGMGDAAGAAHGGLIPRHMADGGLVGSVMKFAPLLAMLDGGGLVPGSEVVPGDSPVNDTVPIMGSAGEVMVPKTVRQQGSDRDIANFVRHPPKVKPVRPIGGKDKEALLGALKHLGRK